MRLHSAQAGMHEHNSLRIHVSAAADATQKAGGEGGHTATSALHESLDDAVALAAHVLLDVPLVLHLHLMSVLHVLGHLQPHAMHASAQHTSQ